MAIIQVIELPDQGVDKFSLRESAGFSQFARAKLVNVVVIGVGQKSKDGKMLF